MYIIINYYLFLKIKNDKEDIIDIESDCNFRLDIIFFQYYDRKEVWLDRAVIAYEIIIYQSFFFNKLGSI